jgi:hypothetical protein
MGLAGPQKDSWRNIPISINDRRLKPVIDSITTPAMESAISDQKLGVLFGVLEAGDQKRLRRWLFGGLVFRNHGGYLANGDPEGVEATRMAVERIRLCALRILGVPLVAWIENPPQVVLDLVTIKCSIAAVPVPAIRHAGSVLIVRRYKKKV